MNRAFQVTINKATNDQREAIIQMLQANKLPNDDLPASLQNFLVALDNEKIIGVIGLELYDNCGLLRSLVVQNDYRDKNIATQLVNHLEKYAKTVGADCLYLLTETAPGYFERKGYKKIARQEVSKELQASSEFIHVCPVSAIVMKKPPT